MAYVPHAKDEKDEGGHQLVRARYIEPDKDNADETWLVYDNAGDTCGAVKRSASLSYLGYSHGKLLSVHKDLRACIASLLPTVAERNEFTGHKG